MYSKAIQRLQCGSGGERGRSAGLTWGRPITNDEVLQSVHKNKNILNNGRTVKALEII